MAIMALVSSASCAIFTLVTALLLITGYRSELSRALAMLIAPYAIWSFGNTFMFNAPDVATAIFWDNTTSFGWAFFPTAMIHFTLVFTNYSPKIPPWLKGIIYFLPPLILIPAQWYGQISIADVEMWYGRTIRIADSPFSWFFTVQYIIYVFASLTIIAIHIKNSSGYRKKRAIIIFWSYLIAFLLASITENLLPALHLTEIPPLVVVASLILVFGIIFAIMRYNMLLVLNPSGIMLYSLNQSRTALKNILDSYPHFMFVVDRTALIHHSNRNAIQRFSTHRGSLAEQKIEILFDDSQQEQLHHQLTLVSNTLLPQENNYHLVGKDGLSFPATVTISPLTDPEHYHAGFIISIIDIATYKEAEKNLKNARDRAREADRSKSEFLANISHELRTPMNAIIGFTNLLQETEKDYQIQERLSIINSSGKYLLALVNDLLDIARIESGKLSISLESIDVNAHINETVQLFPSTGKTQLSVNIASSVPHTIIIDPIRLKQILTNLLSNAFKFTPEGTIKLALTYHTPLLTITVVDTGIGISEKDQQRIFEKFAQGDADIDKNRGTGIGLAIVKKLTELMDGSVTLTSKLGKGSTFTITLPLADKESIEPAFFS